MAYFALFRNYFSFLVCKLLNLSALLTFTYSADITPIYLSYRKVYIVASAAHMSGTCNKRRGICKRRTSGDRPADHRRHRRLLRRHHCRDSPARSQYYRSRKSQYSAQWLPGSGSQCNQRLYHQGANSGDLLGIRPLGRGGPHPSRPPFWTSATSWNC